MTKQKIRTAKFSMEEIENINALITDASIVSFRSPTSITSWVSNPYLVNATSENTRKAYRSDIKHYEKWGGILPATPETIIHYLQAFASTLNSRTLARRLIAIKHWHTYQGFPDTPSSSNCR